MQKTIRDLRVKAIIILESLNHITKEQLVIKDQFSKSINECLNKLITCEFVVRNSTHLPFEVIEGLKGIINEDACNLLFINFLLESPAQVGEYYFDPSIYHGNEGVSVFSVSAENAHYRNSRVDQIRSVSDLQSQLKEKTSILFKSLTKAIDDELSILNELCNSFNSCLKNLFTLEFVERTKPRVKLQEIMDLDEIIDPDAFAVLKKLSVSSAQFMDYVPPLITYPSNDNFYY